MSPPTPSEPSVAVLVVAREIADGDVRRLCERLAAVVAGSDAEVVVCDVRGLPADIASVDALARLALTARRLGRRIRLQRASAELERLVAFAGLAGALPGLCRGGPVGHAEQRE